MGSSEYAWCLDKGQFVTTEFFLDNIADNVGENDKETAPVCWCLYVSLER